MTDADGQPLTAEQMDMPAGTPMGTSWWSNSTTSVSDRMVMTHVGVPADSPGGQGWTMAIEKTETGSPGCAG